MYYKIKVLIVDDHEMVRMGLNAYLSTEADIEIIGEANGGRQAIAKAVELFPDVILMDLVMEDIDGIQATKRIIEEYSTLNKTIKIIALTSFIDDDKVFSALEAGAFSYLLKTSSASEVVEAIRKAVNNKPVFESEVTTLMLNRVQKKSPKHSLLTQRELEVLKLIGEGKNNKEIGEELYIGIKTVKTHVSNILSKLELEDRTKAAVYANQNNILY
ncbi:response regulator [Alkaliphilus peptidifermentans]|uniref:Stage 0 sporulation protein A homolog n=1 Tax=Alkaliphilus peptidifermentans DSM 18978 TaxID=1120976 RepID=A0A1G5JMR7_9FIRM|nr:response regulator transcription factor [Alkaliphilus peptidifermentans]SCY89221.1 two component transcriptional regulator, LuxR family [Alkaliphilus peptidifermentans DSM 18978]